MDKRTYYEIQTEAFGDYAGKFPGQENLLSLFNGWAISKNIYGIDRHRIWLKAREMRLRKTILIREGSEEQRRVSLVVDVLHKADLLFLEDLIDKRAGKI